MSVTELPEAPTVEIRTADFVVERASSDGLTLTGYAAVFNDVTRIDSYEGRFDEQIAPGAFRRTLQRRTPVLQFDHGSHGVVGSIPIGAIESIREDARGLYIEARLHDNWLVEPVRDAIASGAISGMSFRFSVTGDEWDTSGETPMRTIKSVNLMELGPVVFPAYESTTVGVRSEVLNVLTQPELRTDLARALVLSGSSDELAVNDSGTSNEPAEAPDEGVNPLAAARSRRQRQLAALARFKGITHEQDSGAEGVA